MFDAFWKIKKFTFLYLEPGGNTDRSLCTLPLPPPFQLYIVCFLQVSNLVFQFIPINVINQ